MANKEPLQILVKRVKSWNQGRQDNLDKVPDLRHADLSGAAIFDADLSGTNLTNADLTRSRFIGCDLRDAVVENARVTYIDIQRLRSLPKPPTQLRIQANDGEVLLTDFEAREFFHVQDRIWRL